MYLPGEVDLFIPVLIRLLIDHNTAIQRYNGNPPTEVGIRIEILTFRRKKCHTAFCFKAVGKICHSQIGKPSKYMIAEVALEVR
jgi:hypothetical protein